MLTRKLAALALAVSLALLASCGFPQSSPPRAVGASASAPAVARSFDKLPLYFVENRGQTDPRVAFYVPGRDTTLYFTPDGLTFAFTSASALMATAGALSPVTGSPDMALPGRATRAPAQRWAVKLDFVGANPDVRPLGESKTQAVFSYFKGQSTQWQAGLPSYAQLRYPELWPGIDLVYSGQADQLKYEFVVQPGADPARIQLAYRGASAVNLMADGQLEVTTPLGGFRDAAPVAYQVKDGLRVPVEMSYALNPATAGDAGYSFHLGQYDSSLPLVLDPAVLVYAGYIGGDGDDFGTGIALDAAGNAYISGVTHSAENTFPVTAGPDLTYNGGNLDAFVAKVNGAGTALVYAGYIGGSGDDFGFGIAVDGAGNAYVTGQTTSDQSSFPATVGPNLTYHGNYDAFIAKVNAAGTALVYAGYIGGASGDVGLGVALDGAGNAYVAGETTSDQTTFPVLVGPDLTYNDSGSYGDAFVAKVNAAGTALIYAGYIGGAGVDLGQSIAVDGAGNTYVTGLTYSDQTTFPVTGGPDLTFNGGQDAFVAKVNAAGTALVYAGYIGGSGSDKGLGIAVDGGGNAYIAGQTNSDQTTFPATVGPDLTYNGGQDAFVAKVNAAGTSLVYAGYIGGAGDDGFGTDGGAGIAVDGAGNAYITGQTTSDQTTFPVTVGPDLTYNGGGDAYVAEVNAAGTALVYAGYIGGSGSDIGSSIAVDAAGNAYVTGYTNSDQTTFPVSVGPDLTYNGGWDAFVAKVSAFATPTPTPTGTATRKPGPTPTRPTRTPTSTRTATPTRTPRPTATHPTRTPSPTQTATPTMCVGC